MIVVDSSAIFAVVFDEPDSHAFLDAILEAEEPVIGAPTLLECRVVALRRAGADWNARLEKVLGRLKLLVVPFEPKHEAIATAAFRQFGKGLNKAGLNFGDCFSYAIAKERRKPLLFKGEDFRHTDIESAL